MTLSSLRTYLRASERDGNAGPRNEHTRRFGARRSGAPWSILLVLIATIASFATSMVLSYRSASEVDANAMSIATDAAPAIEELTAADNEVLELQVYALDAIARIEDGDGYDRVVVDRALSRLDDRLSAYAALPFYPQERAMYEHIEHSTVELKAQLDDVLARLDARDARGAVRAFRDDFTPAASRTDKAISRLIAFNAEQQHELGMQIPRLRQHAIRRALVLQTIMAALAVALMTSVVRAARRYSRGQLDAKRRSDENARALSRFSERLELVVAASATISERIGRSMDLLRSIADHAREVLGADYCALGGAAASDGPIHPWVVSGAPAQQASAAAPRPVGLLGAVANARASIRVADASDDPALRGFPSDTPPIGPFLGTPILHNGRDVANLFFARKDDRPPFTEEDERVASLLAAYAGVAIENARLYEDARRATHAREDLLATVSHDLKNPLSIIRMAVAILRSHDTATTGSLTASIDRATTRMTALVADLLDASKIEAGEFRATLQPQDVESIEREAIELYGMLAAQKSLRLTHDAPPKPSIAMCDRSAILRVLSNLIGNAVKFTPEGGTIGISAGQVDGDVRFTVRDTGPGIPADVLPHLFDRYWQRERSDRRGSGLGLYIAKGIVEAHGGRMWVESTLGEGSAFHFTLHSGTVPASTSVKA